MLMPDISGMDVLRQLRDESSTRALPVLIYTSKVLSDAEKAQLAGLETSVIRKEDISTRLSARPFLEWLDGAGLSPKENVSEQNA
jgi:CheY-like chemotaxis protein